MTRTERLNKLFAVWKKKHNINIFMEDGIVSELQYENVLFILKDVNNAKPDDCNDMRVYLTESTDGGNTWFNVARWVSALLDGKSYDQLEKNIDDKHNGNYHEFQHEQLSRAAIVNLKKEAGGSSVKDRVINDYAVKHSSELLAELEICDPKIIVVCGLGIFEGAETVFGRVTPIAKTRPDFEMAADWKIGMVVLNNKLVPVVQFRHPSRGCNAEKSYNDMLKIREYLSLK